MLTAMNVVLKPLLSGVIVAAARRRRGARHFSEP